MIRTVQIPKRGNVPPPMPASLGCAPGGDCCDECRSHKPVTGPPIGSPATHVHAMSIPSMRNASLYGKLGRLGDIQCDQDGNCYDSTTGELLSAPLTTGAGCSPGQPFCASSLAPWLIGGGVLFTILFSGGGGRRR